MHYESYVTIIEIEKLPKKTGQKHSVVLARSDIGKEGRRLPGIKPYGNQRDY
jgi:hypothetical protein